MNDKYIALTKCFYCGKDDKILINTRFKDISAAHNHVVDMEPCPECKKFMEQGVIIIGVKNGETDFQNPYRTGEFLVVTDSFIERLVSDENLKESILKKRVVFMEQKTMKAIGLEVPK